MSISSTTSDQSSDTLEISASNHERKLALGFAMLGLAVFVIATVLNPYDETGRARSHGTHRQLGLPPCTLKTLTGISCPSCGMTTTISLLMHGNPQAAWQTNWAGCIVAFIGILGTIWFLLVATGVPPGRFTANEVVKAMTITGMAVATIGWFAELAYGVLMATF